MRYRLRTLPILTSWVALVLVALREPTPFWSSAVALFTLLSVLLAVLVVVYRRDESRTQAMGFLVFSVGYLLYVGIVTTGYDSGLGSGLIDVRTPSALFRAMHPEQHVSMEVGGDMILPPPYEANLFLSICNHSLACLFGIGGAVVARHLANKSR